MANWIAIEDYAPAINVPVLLYSYTDGLGVGYRISMAGNLLFYWSYKRINGDMTAEHITHWMPIELPRDVTNKL